MLMRRLIRGVHFLSPSHGAPIGSSRAMVCAMRSPAGSMPSRRAAGKPNSSGVETAGYPTHHTTRLNNPALADPGQRQSLERRLD